MRLYERLLLLPQQCYALAAHQSKSSPTLRPVKPSDMLRRFLVLLPDLPRVESDLPPITAQLDSYTALLQRSMQTISTWLLRSFHPVPTMGPLAQPVGGSGDQDRLLLHARHGPPVPSRRVPTMWPLRPWLSHSTARPGAISTEWAPQHPQPTPTRRHRTRGQRGWRTTPRRAPLPG